MMPFQPIDQAIHLDGAPAYFSNLPVKAMTQSIINQGLPGALSNSAGTFVCNHVLYHLGYLQDKHYPHLRFRLSMCHTYQSRSLVNPIHHLCH
ncbi:pyroglutamyl-peptidase I family protein [Staphylococcus aureus]